MTDPGNGTEPGKGGTVQASLSEFLTPEAMFTPGVLGAFAMMITNALGANFQTPRAWTALALSFGCGLLVLVSAKSRLIKGVFNVLNSLVIFCVASGTNGIGVAQRENATRAGLSISTVAQAFAQPKDEASPPDEKASSEQLLTDYRRLTVDYDALTKKIEAAKSNATPKDAVIEIVNQRDKIDAQRHAIAAVLLKRTDLTAAQLKEIGDPGIFTKALREVMDRQAGSSEIRDFSSPGSSDRIRSGAWPKPAAASTARNAAPGSRLRSTRAT
jgi:hypothetical protein